MILGRVCTRKCTFCNIATGFPNKLDKDEPRKIAKAVLNYAKNKKNVVLDIPLLIENKISTKNLILIFVETKKKEILKRLAKRPNFNKKLFNLIKKNQIASKLKKKKCKFVIKNDFNKVSLKKSISEIKKKLDKYD